MLVKFDHLTLVANRNNVSTIIKEFKSKGYHLALQEEQAKNINTKIAFMKYQDLTHGLHFLVPPTDGGLPIEIVSYHNTTQGNSYIDYSPLQMSFILKSADPISCKELLLTIGCEDDGYNGIKFQGALDDMPIYIDIKKDNDLSFNLDNEGICCPTIFVRPLSKYKKKIEESGFKCSEIEVFEVQGSSLYVFFAESKGGEIFEITSNKL